MLSKLFSVFFIVSLISLAGALELTLSRCCNTGVRWAWENKTCTAYPAPVPNVAAEHQAPCLSTISACCHRNYRERQCFLGHTAAKSGEECFARTGQDSHYYKDCCEGCKLGLIAGAMGLNCQFQSLKLALGPPWDSSLTKCCIQAGGLQSTSSRQDPPRVTERSRPDDSPQLRFTFKPETRDYCSLFAGQLCSQNCVTDGDSYKCTCNKGYTLLPDGKTCRGELSDRNTGPDILILSNRTRERENHQRSGECPAGFVYNTQSQICDDIDECLTVQGMSACFPYKSCRNTIGSFLCEQLPREDERNMQCPPGYRYNEESANCIDIDECAEGFDICVREIQYCINTPGGFDCQGKKEFNKYNCPAGYKFNNKTLNCEDVNECDEKLDSCGKTEVCRNTAGAYECDIRCSEGYRYELRVRSCQDVDECTDGTHDCVIEKESCINVPGSYQCHQLTNIDHNCPPGYEPNKNYTFLCQDTNECSSGVHTCAASEKCINEKGGYRCERSTEGGRAARPNRPGIIDNSIPDTDISTEDSLEDIPRGRKALDNSQGESNMIVKEPQPSCASGMRRPRSSRPGVLESCEDIDECTENNPCDSSQLCQNTVGSFYCHCRRGYYRDPITRACLDINECQTGQHNCQPSQRCDNSPGSFSCIRITGCGTGYTLNSQTGQCEDDDECLFGNNDCDTLGHDWQCKNTLGSFRCEKSPRTCPSELTLAPNGECRPPCPSGYLFNSRGDCVDIDECLQLSSGGRSICLPNQQCVNTKGSYQCLSKIICPAGFEPDPSGNKCIDVDECEKGLHTCRGNQECLNRGGGYICQCPSGYTVTSNGNCEDVDECARYSGHVCSSNAECYNTPGSFRCECKEGFEQGSDNRTCIDVDECRTIKGLCEQNCINTWGSSKCTCGSGYTLSEDQRTCRDVDECAQANGFLCIGNCVNSPGSYRCECPDGYRLGRDSRTCQDIDECLERTACRSDESCLNIRGGFRCNRVQCPPGYTKEGEQNDRCKKTVECSERDLVCMKKPLTISRNFLSFTSNIRIPTVGYVDMFTMRGPNWAGAVMNFNMDLKNSRAPHGVFIASRDHFLLRRPTPHQAIIALSKPIAGPQDVELELTMEVYHRGTYAGSAVAQVSIVVTSYEF